MQWRINQIQWLPVLLAVRQTTQNCMERYWWGFFRMRLINILFMNVFFNRILMFYTYQYDYFDINCMVLVIKQQHKMMML